MPKNALVTLTLTKVEADWLYDLLAETFDEGSSDTIDERHAGTIGERLDAQIEKL